MCSSRSWRSMAFSSATKSNLSRMSCTIELHRWLGNCRESVVTGALKKGDQGQETKHHALYFIVSLVTQSSQSPQYSLPAQYSLMKKNLSMKSNDHTSLGKPQYHVMLSRLSWFVISAIAFCLLSYLHFCDWRTPSLASAPQRATGAGAYWQK